MTQAPLLTVTLNPALDLSTQTAKVIPDTKLRCDQPQFDPGGGGINVSRAIAIMGGASTALVALGGATGDQIATMLRQAGITLDPIPAPGESRQSLAVTDQESGQQYRFVMPGPIWSPADQMRALDAVVQAAPRDGWVVLSGSNPPGIGADFAPHLARHLGNAISGAGLMLDTSGPALRAMAQGGYDIALLRMDGHEARDLAGSPLTTRADTAQFAAALVRAKAARTVIVARGADGSILANDQGIWHAEAAKVAVISRVGAGDSFVAGYALAVAQGRTAPDALAMGTAAASAACMTPATELCRGQDVTGLFETRVVTKL